MRYKKYGVNITEDYYKRTRCGRPPIRYDALGFRSSNKVTDVHIHKDPILKKHSKIENAMMRHELIEIRLRSKGMLEPKAHRIAMSKESKIIRGLSLKKLWEKLS